MLFIINKRKTRGVWGLKYYVSGITLCALFGYRFDGLEFLSKMRGKTVMFVGDSLGRNQWESLVCMISAGVSRSATQMIRGDPLSTFKFLVSCKAL